MQANIITHTSKSPEKDISISQTKNNKLHAADNKNIREKKGAKDTDKTAAPHDDNPQVTTKENAADRQKMPNQAPETEENLLDSENDADIDLDEWDSPEAGMDCLEDPADMIVTEELFVFSDSSGLVPASLGNTLPQVKVRQLPTVIAKDNLQLYLREVSSYPLLTAEEESEIVKKIKESDNETASVRIISAHLRLVVKIAMEFQRRWMQNVLDLIQEGNIGLIRAVNKFDPEKGIKFSYYATFWIRAYILKFIMDNWRMVKIGTTQAQRKLFYNLNKEKQKLISQGFDPDLKVISDTLGVSIDQIEEMEQRLNSTDMSLDMPVNDEHGSITRLDYLPALTKGVEDGFAETEITQIIQLKINKLRPSLSDKEVFILENRLLTDDPITLREIGEKYNVTRERIRQLEARLVTKVRTYLLAEIEDFSENWIQDD